MMSAVSAFMALFVVGSTFGFVVAGRRRELGLLRLADATPRQVRQRLLGESVVARPRPPRWVVLVQSKGPPPGTRGTVGRRVPVAVAAGTTPAYAGVVPGRHCRGRGQAPQAPSLGVPRVCDDKFHER